MRSNAASGYALIELVFAAGIAVTLCGIAVPQLLAGIDDVRTAGAARYVAMLMQRARMEAVMRSADVALQFTPAPSGYLVAMYVDGNRNGVLSRDIQHGIDRRLLAGAPLGDRFAHVDCCALPNAPAVDPGSTPPGTDPIRLGSSAFATFTPTGTSSTGSVYICGRGAQYVVRIYGQTGKIRILKLNVRTGEWKPL